VCLVVGIAVAFGVYTLRQRYPMAGTVWEAAGCVAMRYFTDNLERSLSEADMTENDKARLRREFEQMRREFEGQCGALR
jgi:hypothetical protein